MLHRFWKPSWLENPSKMRPRIDPRGNRCRHRFWHRFVIAFWWKLGATAHCRHSKNLEKPIVQLKVFGISAILSWCLVGRIFWWMFDDLPTQKPIICLSKNQWKIYLKINQPLDAISDRYLVDFGQIFEAKLDPSWIKIQRKNELKIHWFFDHCFDRNFIHLGRIFGPTWRQIGFLNFLGDVFRGVVMPLGAKMASRTPRECPKEQFWTTLHRFFFDFWSMLGWFFVDDLS